MGWGGVGVISHNSCDWCSSGRDDVVGGEGLVVVGVCGGRHDGALVVVGMEVVDEGVEML